MHHKDIPNFRNIEHKMITIQEKTRHLQNLLDHLLRGTSMKAEIILENGFLKDWQSSQEYEIQEKFQRPIQCLERMLTKSMAVEEKLSSAENMKLVFDVDRMHALGVINSPVRTSADNPFNYNKLFELFFEQLSLMYRSVSISPVWSIYSLNAELMTLERISYRAESLLEKLELCEPFHLNSTMYEDEEENDSDEMMNDQQMNFNSYWEQLHVKTPKIDQQLLAMIRCTRISDQFDEINTENQFRVDYYAGRRLSIIGEDTINMTNNSCVSRFGKLDPIFMLSNTMQRINISNDSKYNNKRLNRVGFFAMESNNNQSTSSTSIFGER